MAEGLLRHDAGERFEVCSAGTRPTGVRDEAIHVMNEIGIDISTHHSKHVDDFLGETFDYVVTVCDNARDTCPVFPGATRSIHRAFEDPPAADVGTYDQRVAVFRRVRDEIRHWLRQFVRDADT